MNEAVRAPAAPPKNPPKEVLFDWVGTDTNGQPAKGEMRAPSQAYVKNFLATQGIRPKSVQRRKVERSNTSIKPKEVAIFTRQLATMMKSGVPLLPPSGAPSPEGISPVG